MKNGPGMKIAAISGEDKAILFLKKILNMVE